MFGEQFQGPSMTTYKAESRLLLFKQIYCTLTSKTWYGSNLANRRDKNVIKWLHNPNTRRALFFKLILLTLRPTILWILHDKQFVSIIWDYNLMMVVKYLRFVHSSTSCVSWQLKVVRLFCCQPSRDHNHTKHFKWTEMWHAFHTDSYTLWPSEKPWTKFAML